MKPRNAFFMAVLGLVWCLGILFAQTDITNASEEKSFSNVTTLLSPSPKVSDGFGRCVAVDGSTIAVGGDQMEAVHVFVYESNGWTHQATLQPPAGESSGRFGNAVAVHGDRIAATNLVPGAVYIFVRSGTSWALEAKLTHPDDYFFGSGIGLYGDTLVVGDSSYGSAHVYERQGTEWRQVASLTPSDTQESGAFGESVAIFGNTILVGAPEYTGGFSSSGAAYVFVNNGGWIQQARLTPSDPGEEHFFGIAVDLNDDTALIGAHGDSGLAHNAGSAYVFVRSGSTWTLQAKINNPEPGPEHAFGFSVGLDRGRAIVGAYGAPGPSPHSFTTGAAFVFSRDASGGWSLSRKLHADPPIMLDFFGWSVAVSGEVFVGGAPWRNEARGAAFAYGIPQPVQNPVPDIKANGSNGPISIASSDPLSVAISLDPGDQSGANADWWIVASTPFGWYFYDVMGGAWDWAPGLSVTFQGPLFSISGFEVLNTGRSLPHLAPGTYVFYFGVDMPMDGLLDVEHLFFDAVQVDVW